MSEFPAATGAAEGLSFSGPRGDGPEHLHTCAQLDASVKVPSQPPRAPVLPPASSTAASPSQHPHTRGLHHYSSNSGAKAPSQAKAFLDLCSWRQAPQVTRTWKKERASCLQRCSPDSTSWASSGVKASFFKGCRLSLSLCCGTASISKASSANLVSHSWNLQESPW